MTMNSAQRPPQSLPTVNLVVASHAPVFLEALYAEHLFYFRDHPAFRTISLAILPTVVGSPSAPAISFNGILRRYIAAHSYRRLMGVLSPRLRPSGCAGTLVPVPRARFPFSMFSSMPVSTQA